jgi:hypothetical protein
MAEPSHDATNVCPPAELTDHERAVGHDVPAGDDAFHKARRIQLPEPFASPDRRGLATRAVLIGTRRGGGGWLLQGADWRVAGAQQPLRGDAAGDVARIDAGVVAAKARCDDEGRTRSTHGIEDTVARP